MSRFLMWITDQPVQGWGCSECDWRYTTPLQLTDPEAKSAYDRLAARQFDNHDCSKHPREWRLPDGKTFPERARGLVLRGFKPKDAVELVLQELALEYRGETKILERAKQAADDFLRRVKQGLI